MTGWASTPTRRQLTRSGPLAPGTRGRIASRLATCGLPFSSEWPLVSSMPILEYCHCTASSKWTATWSSGPRATVDGFGSAETSRGWAPAAGAETTMAVAASAATAIARFNRCTLIGCSSVQTVGPGGVEEPGPDRRFGRCHRRRRRTLRHGGDHPGNRRRRRGRRGRHGGRRLRAAVPLRVRVGEAERAVLLELGRLVLVRRLVV